MAKIELTSVHVSVLSGFQTPALLIAIKPLLDFNGWPNWSKRMVSLVVKVIQDLEVKKAPNKLWLT